MVWLGMHLKAESRPKWNISLNFSNSNTGKTVSYHEIEKVLLHQQTIKQILDASFLATGTILRGGFIERPTDIVPSGF